MWYSQCGQDEFVYNLLGENGIFLDIGSGHPTELSNTRALEDYGWTGHCIDILPFDYSQRKATFLQADALSLSWKNFSPDYISLDVDWVCLEVLKDLLSEGITFKVLTIEHNRYCKGDDIRNQMRTLLSPSYTLARADVAFEGNEFEDWWIS